jgi:NCS1 family nucleobase:cation symporter-1
MSEKTTLDEDLQKEVNEGRMPALHNERAFGTVGLTMTIFAWSLATYAFVQGGTVSTLLNLRDGFAATCFGCVIGFALVYYAIIPRTCKYGITTIDAVKPAFGQYGSILISAVLLFAMEAWSLYLLSMSSLSIFNAVKAANVYMPASSTTLPQLIFLISVIFCSFIAIKGINMLNKVYTILAPGLLILGLLLLFLIFSKWNFSQILAFKPQSPYPVNQINFSLVAEWGLGYSLSFFIAIGTVTRHAKSQSAAAFIPSLGIGWLSILYITIGLIVGLALGSFDFNVWALQLGGQFYGTIILLYIAIANITLYSVLIISLEQTLRQYLKRIKFSFLVMIVSIPVIIFGIVPGAIRFYYSHYTIVIGYAGAIFAPFCGVLVADEIMRRRKIDLAQVFDNSKRSKYWYFRGFNIYSLLSLAAGLIVYFLLYDPISSKPLLPGIFMWTTATLPSFGIALMLELLFIKTILLPKKKGDYELKDDKGLLAFIEKPNL